MRGRKGEKDAQLHDQADVIIAFKHLEHLHNVAVIDLKIDGNFAAEANRVIVRHVLLVEDLHRKVFLALVVIRQDHIGEATPKNQRHYEERGKERGDGEKTRRKNARGERRSEKWTLRFKKKCNYLSNDFVENLGEKWTSALGKEEGKSKDSAGERRGRRGKDVREPHGERHAKTPKQTNKYNIINIRMFGRHVGKETRRGAEGRKGTQPGS